MSVAEVDCELGFPSLAVHVGDLGGPGHIIDGEDGICDGEVEVVVADDLHLLIDYSFNLLI